MDMKSILIIDGENKYWLSNDEKWVAFDGVNFYTSTCEYKDKPGVIICACEVERWNRLPGNLPLSPINADKILIHPGQGTYLGHQLNDAIAPDDMEKAKDFLDKLIPFSHGSAKTDNRKIVSVWLMNLADAMKSKSKSSNRVNTLLYQLYQALNRVVLKTDWQKNSNNGTDWDGRDSEINAYVEEQKRRVAELALYLSPALQLARLRVKISEELLASHLMFNMDDKSGTVNLRGAEELFKKFITEAGNLMKLFDTDNPKQRRCKDKFGEKVRALEESSGKLLESRNITSLREAMNCIDDIVLIVNGVN